MSVWHVWACVKAPPCIHARLRPANATTCSVAIRLASVQGFALPVPPLALVALAQRARNNKKKTCISTYIYIAYTLRRRRRNHEVLWFRARAYFRVRVGASPLNMYICICTYVIRRSFNYVHIHMHSNISARERNPDLPQQGCDLLTDQHTYPRQGFDLLPTYLRTARLRSAWNPRGCPRTQQGGRSSSGRRELADA